MGVSVRAGKRPSTTRMKYVYSNRPSKVIHVQEVRTYTHHKLLHGL